MTTAQIIRQAQACHIRFKQLLQDGTIPSGVDVYGYAAQILGHQVDSLKKLTPSELNVLRDALEGKPSKVYDKMLRCADAAGILDLEAWIRAVAQSSRTMTWLRGHTAKTLPVSKQWRLCRLLEVRARAIAPPAAAKQEGPALRLVCAWCAALLRDGVEPTSHGICQSCAAKQRRA